MDELKGCYIQIDAGGPERGNGWDSEYFPMDAIEEAVAYASLSNHCGRNLYVGVNPRLPTCLKVDSACDEHIAQAYWQFADLDDVEAVVVALNGLPVACDLAVYTGTKPHTRLHLYWALAEPQTDLALWSENQQGAAQALGGDKVIDPRRIMRLAGSVSYPNAKKAEKGYIEELVTMGVS